MNALIRLSVIRYGILGLGLLVLMACSRGPVGPDPALLVGTWAQDGVAQTDPSLSVDNAIITYRADGSSDFNAIMTVTENHGIPERFTIQADVSWTLEETVLTRTLQDVRITPDIATPEANALAEVLENAYRASPPGRLIIEQLDGTTLVLLDADFGTTLTYQRQAGS